MCLLNIVELCSPTKTFSLIAIGHIVKPNQSTSYGSYGSISF